METEPDGRNGDVIEKIMSLEEKAEETPSIPV